MIPIVALIFSIPGLIKSYSLGKEKGGEAQIKVMTYNVGVFRDYNDENRYVSDVKKSLAKVIKEENPDVLCLQESGKWPRNTASAFSQMIGYKYYSVNPTNGNSYFSKYPLYDVKSFYNKDLTKFADIKKVKINNNDSFYLANCHLNSFRISDDIDDINEKDVYKSVIRKLVNGFMPRAKITNLLLDKLPDDKLALVICGDFNDTPLSYTYNEMKNAGLKDAFHTASRGIGITYCGKLPLLRIDYFWYNDFVEVVSYKRIKQTTSDHYPLVMEFNINKGEEEKE
ncbi:MAG: endonuclease/exonuclease/phosphatase family protein [Bacteroidales bacterium]|nr:endonuclease/exonuclease/phosphatase family protein [Bacteroidales bacterium]